MALICLHRIFNTEIRHFVSYGSRLDLFKIPSASICSKELRDPNVKKPAPWPYKTKKYTYLRAYIEGTMKRFDENTKIIVVDGNIATGKSSFAKQLAEEFDMLYVPEPTMDTFYVSEYGFDIRKLDPIMPPSFKSCDLSTFYKNPHDKNVAKFQYRMFMLRYEQYIDALAHILNTGQGIVMDRCVYGDYIFMQTMYKFGYISKPAKDLYMDIYKNCTEELLRPHLIIYLDISPDVALERIKKRNIPDEVNSKVLTREYLQSIEDGYKYNYLPELEKHAELLIYDWSNYGDVEVVVEDIEHIDFDRFSKYEDKLKDWRFKDDWEWGYLRRRYANDKFRMLRYADIFRPRVSEVYHPGDEVVEYKEIMKKVPGETYSPGFNPDAGDSVLFKTVHKGYWYLRCFRQ